MSVSLILIPAALAIAGVVGGAGAVGIASQTDRQAYAPAGPGGAASVAVQTRMRDAALLSAALRELGASAVDLQGDELSAVVGDLALTMTRDADGIWAARITGADGREAVLAEAEELIGRVDAAYAGQVQRAVAARIRERADDAGFELLSESREDDDSVTMVLSVRDQR
ncbi:hypothetical protein [Microbacterium sp.]|uniref:hypothetical protein n=1 Tax=Microbacterium sp. TaxID=51671 RepID=UPI0028120555|nr:hypothetical protein [Microbacterium sp.]